MFGREAVFLDSDGAPARVAAHLPSRRREFQAGKILVAVVQKGRLFQQAYPDVTVLRDRGRFLIVELDSGHPALAGVPDEPCFAAYRLEPGAEVYRELKCRSQLPLATTCGAAIVCANAVTGGRAPSARRPQGWWARR